MEVDTEYHKHYLVIWKDIDVQIFCTSHRWITLLDEVYDSGIEIESIRPACYNIWNLNDEWETRAKMIVENIIEVC